MSKQAPSYMRALRAMMEPQDMTLLYKVVGEILVSSMKYNFEVGGRFGSENRYGGGKEKWIPSRRALGLVKSRQTGKKEVGLTLVDTNYLRGSITARPTSRGVRIGTSADYAHRHHDGSDGMERRPIFVVQQDDLEEIKDAIKRFYARKRK